MFKQKQESLEDARDRTGVLVKSGQVTKPELIEKVENIVLNDAGLKDKQLAEMVGESDTVIVIILHLGMNKVSTRWVPFMLTSQQKRAVFK